MRKFHRQLVWKPGRRRRLLLEPSVSGTPKPYWHEGTSYTWVKVDLSGGSDVLHVYFGAVGGADESDGGEVFEFFEDFNYSSVSELTSVWGTYNSPTVTLSNSIVTVDKGHIYRYVGANLILNNVVEVRWRRRSGYSGHMANIGFTFNSGGWIDDSDNYCVSRYNTYNGGKLLFGGNVGAVSDPSTGVWTIVQIYHDSGTSRAYEPRGTLRAQRSWSPPSSAHYILLGGETYGGGNGVADYDWILIRKKPFQQPSVTYNATEIGEWIIDGVLYTKRRKITVSSSSSVSGYQLQIDYSKWNESAIRVFQL